MNRGEDVIVEFLCDLGLSARTEGGWVYVHDLAGNRELWIGAENGASLNADVAARYAWQETPSRIAPEQGKMEAAGIEPALSSPPNPSMSRDFCPSCAAPPGSIAFCGDYDCPHLWRPRTGSASAPDAQEAP